MTFDELLARARFIAHHDETTEASADWPAQFLLDREGGQRSRAVGTALGRLAPPER
jgi:hypothetical protein